MDPLYESPICVLFLFMRYTSRFVAALFDHHQEDAAGGHCSTPMNNPVCACAAVFVTEDEVPEDAAVPAPSTEALLAGSSASMAFWISVTAASTVS